MKILMIANNLAGGGAEKILLTLLEYLKPPRYDVTLLVIKNKGIYLHDIPSHIKTQYMIDVTNGETPFPVDIPTLSSFYKNHIKENYDIEIAFLEGPPTKLLSCSPNTRSFKIAWIHIDLEKVHWTDKYYTSLDEERQCYMKMDKLVFVSENARQSFQHLFGMDTPNSMVINNPINTAHIRTSAQETAIPMEYFSAVIVGSLAIRKGHSRLLYAMGRLFEQGYSFHLYVVGEGEEKRSLKELSHLLNLEEYVHFVGFQKNPYPYMANANLLISSSISEGFPLVSSEALALGIPVLATDCTGNSDVLQNGKYGMLVKNTEEGLFCGLKNILDSPQLYQELKNKALLALNEAQFDIRLKQIECLLEEAVNV